MSETNDVNALVMPEFTQGVCSDGAAILMDGQPITIEEILQKLRRGEEAENLLKESLEVIGFVGMQDVYIDFDKRTSVEVDIEMFLNG